MRLRAGGFSLLEVMIVVLLLAVASAVVYPSMSAGLRGLRLESTARQIVTLMKSARSRAVQQQKLYRVGFHREKNVYILANEYGETIREFALAKELTLREVVLGGKAVEQDPFFVNFYPNGHSDIVTVVLAVDKGRQVQVEVDPITGLARVEKKDGEQP